MIVLVHIFHSYYLCEILMKSEFLKLLGGFGWFSYMAEEWGWCEEG